MQGLDVQPSIQISPPSSTHELSERVDVQLGKSKTAHWHRPRLRPCFIKSIAGAPFKVEQLK